MITVLFFAKYREQLGTSHMTLDLASATTVSALKKRLVEQGGDDWAAVLFADNTLCAVNQTVASPAKLIADGDEVAFYPPVTGG
jgi:molybdopterin synthase sulfur carrier subunit